MLLLFVFLNLHFDGSIWQTMQQSKSALTVEYCELDHYAHFFRQSINTYSNLAYFFLGMIVVLIRQEIIQRLMNILQKNNLFSLYRAYALGKMDELQSY